MELAGSFLPVASVTTFMRSISEQQEFAIVKFVESPGALTTVKAPLRDLLSDSAQSESLALVSLG